MRALLATALAAVISAAIPSLAAPASGARGFLDDLYARYQNEDFCPTCNAKQFFDSGLATLLDKDAEFADGEVGSFDGDPVCQCQDPDGMKAKIVSVAQKGPAAATADVELRFGSETRRVRFDLVLEKGAWRIHDVHSSDTPSLRKLLEDGTAR